MIKGDEQYIFGDCAINPELDAQGLAEITLKVLSLHKVLEWNLK